MRVTDVKKKRKKVKQIGWDKAIADAENQIAIATERLHRLREIVAEFKQMKESGQPWPSQQH